MRAAAVVAFVVANLAIARFHPQPAAEGELSDAEIEALFAEAEASGELVVCIADDASPTGCRR